MMRRLALMALLALAAPVAAATPRTPAVPARSQPGLRVHRVVLQGLRTVSARALAPLVRRHRPRGRLAPAARRRRAARLRRALTAWLRDQGYGAAQVTLHEVRPGAHTSFVVWRVTVQEGPRARVGALDVTGIGPRDRLRALGRLTLRSGQFFRPGDLRSSREAVADLFGDRGHGFVRVDVRRRTHPGGRLQDLTFHVTPGPLVTIGAVRITGASRTGQLLVQRALILRAGDRYHRSRLHGAIRRLRRSGAFRRVQLHEKRLGPRRVALHVTVAERP